MQRKSAVKDYLRGQCHSGDSILAWKLSRSKYWLHVTAVTGDQKLQGMMMMVSIRYNFAIAVRGGFSRRLTYWTMGSGDHKISPRTITGNYRRTRKWVKCNAYGCVNGNVYVRSDKSPYEITGVENCPMCDGRGRYLA